MSENITCQPANYTQNMIFNIVVHITILFIILSVFFILIVNKVTHNAINNEFKKIIDKTMTPQINKIINDYPNLKSLIPNNTSLKIFSDEDITVQTNNKWQLIAVLMTIGFLITLSVIYPLILKLSCNICISVKHILLLNLAIFVFIGGVEYLFFTFFASKYIPIKPSAISNFLLKNVKEVLQN